MTIIKASDMFVVNGRHYQSEEHYHQYLKDLAVVQDLVAKAPEKYPPACGLDGHDELSCDCPRVDVIHYDLIGCPHDVSVSMAAIGYATQIRQYGFDGHDSAFDSFQDEFVETNYPDDPQLYIKWVADHQPAVQWAIDFASLREYL